MSNPVNFPLPTNTIVRVKYTNKSTTNAKKISGKNRVFILGGLRLLTEQLVFI